MGQQPVSGLIGRVQETAAVSELLDRGSGGLLFVGGAGTGKTRMLTEAAAIAQERHWQVEHRSVPGGLPEPQNLVEFPRPAGGAAGLVLCLDNAHLLNAASSAAAFRAVAEGRSTVLLATLLDGAAVPDPLLSLWKDGVCGRCDLCPLDRQGADELARAVLDGLVDGTTLARLWRLARGNPLYVRELIAAGLAGGELAQHRMVWQWHGRMAPAGRLLQLVEAHIGVRLAVERDALDLVAVGEPLSPEALDRAGADPAALESLEYDGLVEVAEVGRRMLVRTTHPMLGAAVRASAGALRTRGLQRRLAVAWSAFDGRADDALRLAAAMIGSGDQPASRAALLGASDRAGGRRDFRVMEQVARTALESGGGVFAAAQLGEALAWQRRHEEAEEVLARYASQAVTDSEHVAIAGRRAAILRWGLDRPEDAWEVLRSVEGALSDRSAWPGVAALRQRFLALDEALAPEAGDSRTRLANERACIRLSTDHWDRIIGPSQVTRIFLLVAGGRVAEAIAHAEGRHGEDEDLVSEQARPLHREAMSYGLCLAHIAAGNVAEATRLAEAGYQRTTDRQWRLYAAMWAGCLGEVAFMQGRIRESLHRMQEAVATASVAPQPHPYALLIEHLALTGVTRAAALLGDLATAEAAVGSRAELAPLPSAVMTNWTGDYVVWLEVARGQTVQAVELAFAMAAESAAQQLVGFELAALHLAARLGAPGRAAELLAATAARTGGQLPVDGTWSELAILHIRALAEADAVALDGLSHRFAELGAMLVAAECAGAASLAYGRAERPERAAALDAAVRANRWAALCEGAKTPTLTSLLEPQLLTARQREITRLVMSGMQSREIAAHLVVSVRTVDNALGVIYRKLGVRSRQELSVLLEPFDLAEESASG